MYRPWLWLQSFDCSSVFPAGVFYKGYLPGRRRHKRKVCYNLLCFVVHFIRTNIVHNENCLVRCVGLDKQYEKRDADTNLETDRRIAGETSGGLVADGLPGFSWLL